ncbi:MAG: flippase-like domain-containing protein [Nitrospirae bacterium]|nr:flippase-like domain-containing protein [Nitrospirota bacterium]
MERKKNRLPLLILKAAVSIGLLLLIFRKADLKETIQVVKYINPLYFFLASLCYMFGQFVSTIRWWLLLPEDMKPPELTIKRLYALYLLGSFFNNLLPGIVGGDALRVYYLYRDETRGGGAFGSVFADRYIGYASLLFLGLLATLFVAGRIENPLIRWLIPAMALLFLLFSVGLFGIRFAKGVKPIRAFYEYVDRVGQAPKRLFIAFWVALLVQVISIFSVYLIVLALNVRVELLELFFFMPVVITVSSIPLSISGLGLREGSFVVLLGMIGIKPEVATSLSLMWFLSYVVGSLPGLPIYLKWKSLKR